MWKSGVLQNGLSGSRTGQKGSGSACAGNHVGQGEFPVPATAGGVEAQAAGRVRKARGPEKKKRAVGSGERGGVGVI